MSARTGTRRAAVLLALSTMQPKTVSRLARETGLKYGAVEGVLDSLSRQDLVTLAWEGEFLLASGPAVEKALAEARKLAVSATVQASEQPDRSAVFSAASDGASLPASLPASSRVTRGPDR